MTNETTVTVMIKDRGVTNTSHASSTVCPSYGSPLEATFDAGVQALLGAMLAHGFNAESVSQFGEAIDKAKEGL